MALLVFNFPSFFCLHVHVSNSKRILVQETDVYMVRFGEACIPLLFYSILLAFFFYLFFFHSFVTLILSDEATTMHSVDLTGPLDDRVFATILIRSPFGGC